MLHNAEQDGHNDTGDDGGQETGQHRGAGGPRIQDLRRRGRDQQTQHTGACQQRGDHAAGIAAVTQLGRHDGADRGQRGGGGAGDGAEDGAGDDRHRAEAGLEAAHKLLHKADQRVADLALTYDGAGDHEQRYTQQHQRIDLIVAGRDQEVRGIAKHQHQYDGHAGEGKGDGNANH